MVYRTRINYTAAQKADIWDRWQRGESLNSIGRLFDRHSTSIFGLLAPTGGIRPHPRRSAVNSIATVATITIVQRRQIKQPGMTSGAA